ncbi:MAG TPA: acyl-CoA dehydrogenase family protein, partial [Vineibacter sp.]|nr:acyl-CoA dehydrogenase family protein [Vineibacter sp.]
MHAKPYTVQSMSRPPQNMPAALADYNAYETHAALREGVAREGAGWAAPRLSALGERVGSARLQACARIADVQGPQLRHYTRSGQRIDDIEFHPAWHEWMGVAIASEAHSLGWTSRQPGAEVARAALFFMLNEVENGQACTMGMTHASVAAIRAQPDVSAVWEPRIIANRYDPRSLPAEQKSNAMIGMGMTEIQAGSDVRQISSEARPVPGAPGEYAITGHKWFLSAPTSDAFLMLARTGAGISCFLMPRFCPDGTRNAILLHRLKDKLGDRANATTEAELRGAWGRLLGEEGRGIATILRMVQYTRMNTALGSVGIAHQALVQALHYTRQRQAFGKAIGDHGLMRNVLADLALECEGMVAMMLRVARSFDEARHDPRAGLFMRLAVAVQKYWTCKRTPWAVYEALECLGGSGYVEDWPLARLYRQAPLNSVWEGSGNVICLDVLRVLQREPEALAVMLDEIRLARDSTHPAIGRAIAGIKALVMHDGDRAWMARELTERLALALQASLLVRHAPPVVGDAFCASRLGEGWR